VNNRRQRTREVIIDENHWFLEAIRSSKCLGDVKSVLSCPGHTGNLKSGLEVQFGVIDKSIGGNDSEIRGYAIECVVVECSMTAAHVQTR
jgi:hypothetical protein